MERMKLLPAADQVLVHYEQMGKNDMIVGYCTIIIVC